MKATMLLCDAAEQVGGKLYILGGGWNQAAAGAAFNLALAVVVEVPWDQTGRSIVLRATLLDEDGRQIQINELPLAAEAKLEVAPPSSAVKPGSDLNVPLALRFNGVQLSEGRYTWSLTVDGEEVARCAFAAVSPA